MAVVDHTDVEARLGRVLTDLERQQVDAWAEDLEAMIAARVPNLPELMAAGTVTFQVVRMVYAQAIRRMLLNPEGLRQSSETIDDFTTSKTFDSEVSASVLHLTPEEWALLSPGSSSGAFSIRAYGAPDYMPRSGYWPANPLTWETGP